MVQKLNSEPIVQKLMVGVSSMASRPEFPSGTREQDEHMYHCWQKQPAGRTDCLIQLPHSLAQDLAAVTVA